MNKKELYLILLLMACGLLGVVFSVFLSRNGMTIIIIGFGFAFLQLHNILESKKVKIKNCILYIVILVIVALLSISAVIFTGIKYKTSFNYVLMVGFIILQIWNTYTVICDIKKIESSK